MQGIPKRTWQHSVLDDTYISLVENKGIYDSPLHESASEIVRQCANALTVSRASVWLLSEDQSELQCLSLYIRDSDSFENVNPIDLAYFPSYFQALESSRFIDADDALTDPRTKELADSYLAPIGVKSMLDATLRRDGVFQGVLCVENTGSHHFWTNKEKAFVASVADLLSQTLILEQLKRSEARYKAVIDSSSEGVMLYNGENRTFQDMNPAALKMFGATADEMIGKSPIDVSPSHQCDGQPSALKAIKYIEACLNGSTQNFEWRHSRIDGSEFDVEITLNAVKLSGEDTLFALIRDISEKKEIEKKRQLAQEKLTYRAEHDSLTGLLNRNQLHTHVNSLIAEAKSQQSIVNIALLLFDLNRFKEINDTLGHAAGDKVLQKLAKLLNQHIENAGGCLFRLGGDEFVAAFESNTCKVPFEELESLLNQALNTSIDINDISVEMAASIGIALYPENGQDSHELLRCADVAMYHAKDNDSVSSFYDVKNDLNNKRRLAMMVELGLAIREDQLTLYFQPRINIKTGNVNGCEALLRWNHPEHGLVPPGEFLPLAEMSDLIHPLTAWVMKKACEQIKHLRNKGYKVPIAVNVSARNLADSQLAEIIKNLLDTNDIPPHLFEIEITESALINHPQRALKNLKMLDSLGISIALDDFGTGYSSLSHLTQLPLDTVKIDRSFVKDMLTKKSDAVIVSSTINLAQNLSFKVVAEGVEDQRTLDALDKMQCDQAQGFFIAKPMPSEEFERWLNSATQNHHA